jgi:hypothetical protein
MTGWFPYLGGAATGAALVLVLPALGLPVPKTTVGPGPKECMERVLDQRGKKGFDRDIAIMSMPPGPAKIARENNEQRAIDAEVEKCVRGRS